MWTPIDAVMDAALAAPLEGTAWLEARQSFVVHGVGGSLVLLVITTLSVYKPRGVIGLRFRPSRQQPPQEPR